MMKILAEKLRQGFEFKTGLKNLSIKLPTAYDYYILEDVLYLTIKKPNKNMQCDDGAFDAWALVVKRWIEGTNQIILSWEKPIDLECHNYQRFLYRVKKSTSIYDWLKVEDDSLYLLDDLLIKDTGDYVVNCPSQEAKENPTGIEARIEEIFARDYNQELSKVAGMDQEKLYRQLPVGVFKEKVSENNKIFSAGGATIDLWGLNESKNELHLFELKSKYDTKENKPMGIYSQLFFYSMIQYELIENGFNIDQSKLRDYRGFKYINDYGYQNIKSIKAYFLVDEIHTLIDKEIINLINNSFKLKGIDIEFDIIKYKFSDEDLVYLERA